jgi:hypothetical protein
MAFVGCGKNEPPPPVPPFSPATARNRASMRPRVVSLQGSGFFVLSGRAGATRVLPGRKSNWPERAMLQF